MLCLSGFELYSRWVPLTDQHCLPPRNLLSYDDFYVDEEIIFVNEMFGLLRSLLEHTARVKGGRFWFKVIQI